MNYIFGRKNVLIISVFLCLLVAFFIISMDKASAEVNDATVTTSSDSNNQDATVTNVTPSTRRAPVSIANYNNIVTESADTYDYNNVNNAPIIVDYATVEPTATVAPTQPTVEPCTTVEPIDTPAITSAPINNTDDNFTITNQVIIGDSRTVHMKLAVGDNGHTWSCKSAMGLKWLKSTGVPNVESKITNGTAVIILMGVNDLYNTNNYIDYIYQKANEWNAKGAKTYFVSVNPINEATYSGFKNSKIETFNNNMQTNLTNVTYIDTYSYLITHDISFTSDGLHYKNSTSKKIYELIQEALK